MTAEFLARQVPLTAALTMARADESLDRKQAG
jgi:hypothetical protein